MSFSGITATSIAGTQITGVQAKFPRFTFDVDSRPSLAQVQQYASSAILRMERRVIAKGYAAEDITDGNDLAYVAELLALEVAAEVSLILDGSKDKLSANPMKERFECELKTFIEAQNPFPLVQRRYAAQAEVSETVDRLSRRRGLPLSQGAAYAEMVQRFAYNELPGGDIDGVNDTFTLAFAPNPAASLVLTADGTALLAGTDYTLSGQTLTMAAPPADGVALVAVVYGYLG